MSMEAEGLKEIEALEEKLKVAESRLSEILFFMPSKTRKHFIDKWSAKE